MVDVNDRFEAKGANVILQPEAFSGWAYQPAPWEPDIFKEGGFANLQKYPAWQVNVDASLTGNFFDTFFDGQSAIIGRKRKAPAGPLGPQNAWIGQNPETAFLRDRALDRARPGHRRPVADARRAPPAARGRRREADRGTAVRDVADGRARAATATARAVIWEDVRTRLDHRAAPRPACAQRPGVRAQRGRRAARRRCHVAQHAPRVAAHGELRVRRLARGPRRARQRVPGGQPQPRPALPRARCASATTRRGTVAELLPTVAARAGRGGRRMAGVRRRRAATTAAASCSRVSTSAGASAAATCASTTPTRAASGCRRWRSTAPVPVVAWIDERDRGPQDLPLEHVYAARGTAGGGFGAKRARRRGGARPAGRAPRQQVEPDDRRGGRQGVRRLVRLPELQLGHLLRAQRRRRAHVRRRTCRIDDFQGFERINERRVPRDRPERPRARGVDRPARARARHEHLLRAQRQRRRARSRPNRQLDDSKAGFDPEPRHAHEPVAPGPRRGRRPPVRRVAGQPPRQQRHLLHAPAPTAARRFAPPERVDDTGAGQSEQSRPSLAWADGLVLRRLGGQPPRHERRLPRAAPLPRGTGRSHTARRTGRCSSRRNVRIRVYVRSTAR